MFRSVFGVLAALILTTGAAPAASSSADVPLAERIANAQAKIAELSKLPVAGEAKAGSEAKSEKLAQHWHNWHNWSNHHHR